MARRLDDFITTKWWAIIDNCCSNENYYSYQFTLLTLDWSGSNESERCHSGCVCFCVAICSERFETRVPRQFGAFARPNHKHWSISTTGKNTEKKNAVSVMMANTTACGKHTTYTKSVYLVRNIFESFICRARICDMFHSPPFVECICFA